MAKGDLILAADFGTSGVKIGAVGPDLTLLATAIEPYPLSLPGPDCAEQAPQDWWNALVRGVARLDSKVPDLKTRTGAVVFCAQMCGLICADKDGAPLRPAMVWLDKRSAPLMRRLVGGFPAIAGYNLGLAQRWIRIANGGPSRNGMDPTGKMLWIKSQEPDIYDRTATFMDVKDWLVQRATGQIATTADSANLTWLMDTRRGREGWSPLLAKTLGIPLDKLPPIVSGEAEVGGLTTAAAAQLGLRAGTKVIAGGGDVSAAAIGSGAVADGALHLSVSSSSWVSGFFDRRVLSVNKAYATITSSVGFRPLLIATQESGGSALGWLAKVADPMRLGNGEALQDFYSDLGDAKPDDPYFLPWLAGERVPVDEERLRGTFYGLSLRHDQNALKRSLIEGVALNTRWAFSVVSRQRGVRNDIAIPMVGGAAANPWLAQAIADALNRQICVGDARFSGVLGAAAMAAPAMGWAYSVWQAAEKFQNQSGPVYDPQPDRVAQLDERYEHLSGIRRAMIKLYRRPATGQIR